MKNTLLVNFFLKLLKLLFICTLSILCLPQLISCQRNATLPESDALNQLEKEEPGFALFYKTFDKCRMKTWMDHVAKDPDSLFNAIYSLEISLLEPEQLSLAALGSEQNYLDHYTAKKIFTLDSLPTGDEPVYPFVIPIGATKNGTIVSAYTLQDPNAEETCNLYFTFPTKVISAMVTSHSYGFQYQSFQSSEGDLIFCTKFDFGSGTGSVWENYFFYKIDESGMHPYFQIPAEVSFGIPSDMSRYRNYETTLVDTPNLIFKIKYSSILAIRESEIDMLLDSSVIRLPLDSSNQNFNQEKLLALYNFYFTDDADRLFIHAFRKKLLANYLNANPAQRSALRSYYYHTIFDHPESSSQTEKLN